MFGTHYWSVAISLLLLAAGVSTSLLNVQARGTSSYRGSNLQRAIAAYEALQAYFYLKDTKLYRAIYPYVAGRPFAELWPYSQALTATVDMLGLPGLGTAYWDDARDRLMGLLWYWNGRSDPPGYESYVRPPLGEGGDKFYDDNEWVGLALVGLYYRTDDLAALERARQLFDLVVSGWDHDPSSPAPGGVFWTQARWNRSRNTVSTATGAKLGLHLYQILGDSYYLSWSKRMYEWTNQYMLAPNGLYWDHITPTGVIRTNQWSYNQGTMIGASVLLYRATGDHRYLEHARQTADIALEHYGSSAYFSQPAVFNVVFFKNLMLLYSESYDERYLEAAQSYADQVWEAVRDPSTGLFRFQPSGRHRAIDHAAMVQLYASLAQDPRGYRRMI